MNCGKMNKLEFHNKLVFQFLIRSSHTIWSKGWFKPFTAFRWETLFFTWSAKLFFLVTSVLVINLSIWALIEFDDEATSLLLEEECFTIYQFNFTIFITLSPKVIETTIFYCLSIWHYEMILTFLPWKVKVVTTLLKPS